MPENADPTLWGIVSATEAMLELAPTFLVIIIISFLVFNYCQVDKIRDLKRKMRRSMKRRHR